MKNAENPEPVFDRATGLIPAIAQDYRTGEVLMMAWMNRDAWDATRREGLAVYWSRSRKKLWRKGESSGNIQEVQDVFLDCDRDTVLLKVRQVGDAACHTGRRSCFFTRLTETGPEITSEPLFNPDEVYRDR